MTKIPVPMGAPLTEAPFYTLTCHLELDDSYDAINDEISFMKLKANERSVHDSCGYIEDLSSNVEYIEIQNRRNNIKILGVSYDKENKKRRSKLKKS